MQHLDTEHFRREIFCVRNHVLGIIILVKQITDLDLKGLYI